MNAAVEEEKGEVEVEAPGQRLRRLREQKGLDLAQVANLLHLSAGKLQALEADQYDQLSGSVFIQGYLRNYARLLDIPAEPLLEAFRAQNPQGERKVELRVPQVKHEVRSSHLVVRLITWIIVLGLLALVVTWWRGYIDWPLAVQQDTETLPQQAETSEDSATVGVGEPLRLAGSSLPTLVEQGEQQIALPNLVDGAGDDPTQLEAQADRSEAVAEQNAEPGANPVHADDLATKPTEAPESLTAEAPAQPAADADVEARPAAAAAHEQEAANSPAPSIQGEGIEVVLTGDSWTEIRGAGGGFKILGVLRKGEQRRLEGEGPFRIVLGNASVVEIRIDGRLIDFSRFTRGNVARFELRSDGALAVSQ